MTKWSRLVTISLVALACFFFILSALAFNYDCALISDWRLVRLGVDSALLLAGAGFLTAARWFKEKYKLQLLFVIYLLVFVEGALQLLAVLGLLPSLSFHAFVPYARVYWTKEGFGNGVCNRYGWYYPPHASPPEARRIAVIGDSFITAHQISRYDNVGWRLQKMLRDKGDKADVYAFGMPGLGPAYYLELLKYAHRRFNVQEVVVFVFIGNDFRNSSATLQPETPPDKYIYYTLKKDGSLSLVPESEKALKRFNRGLEANHASLLLSLPEILKSNCILFNVAYNIFNNCVGFYEVVKKSGKARKSNGAAVPPSSPVVNSGLNDSFFKQELSADEKEAVDIAKALLLECGAYAKANGIQLRLVTIPRLTQDFYRLYRGRKEWDTKVGDGDLFIPERMLTDLATANGISILPGGEVMRQAGLTVDEVQTLYTTNGGGHFS